MSRRRVAGPSDPVYVYPWRYMGGEVITPGAASAQITIPDTVNIVELQPNGADVYFAINDPTGATALSPGYVADGERKVIGPLANLNRLDVYMASNSVHIMFYREYN